MEMRSTFFFSTDQDVWADLSVSVTYTVRQDPPQKTQSILRKMQEIEKKKKKQATLRLRYPVTSTTHRSDCAVTLPQPLLHLASWAGGNSMLRLPLRLEPQPLLHLSGWARGENSFQLNLSKMVLGCPALTPP